MKYKVIDTGVYPSYENPGNDDIAIVDETGKVIRKYNSLSNDYAYTQAREDCDRMNRVY